MGGRLWLMPPSDRRHIVRFAMDTRLKRCIICISFLGSVASRPDRLAWEKQMRMSGGCLCGKVKYTAEGDPVFTAVCHCRNCQKQAGTFSSVVVAVPAAGFSMTGPIKTFEDTGDSGKPVHRRFCSDCGSPIISEVDVMPGLTLRPFSAVFTTKWRPSALAILFP